ncbi:MAG: TolC family protein [Ignavibacteria bacterium]|nr:TolC family protein [Ignavibacteria bacterium]
MKKGIFKKSASLFIFLVTYLFLFNSNIKATNITLEEAIKLGVSNNKEIKIQKMNIEKAEQAVKEARGHAFPTLDFTTSYYHYLQKPIFFFPDFLALLNNSTYGILFKEGLIPQDQTKFVPMGLIKQSFVLRNQFEAKFQLNQILFNSTVFRGIGASKIYLELSKYNYKAIVSKTIANIKKAFYLCILLKSVKEIYEQSLKNAEENLSLVNSLYSKGLVSEFDLMQAEVQVENLKPIVENSIISYKNSLNNLKMLLDIPIEKELEPIGELSYFDYSLPEIEKGISKALEFNLDLKTLEYKKKVDIEMVELYRSENYPSLVAFGNFSLSGQSDKLNFQTYTQSLVGLQLSINLFNGFQTQARVQQSVINYKETEEQILQFKSYLIKLLMEKYSEFEKAKKQIAAQEKNIKLAEKAYLIAQTRYKEGTGIQLEVKNAEMELRQSKLNYKQAIFDYLNAIIDIENIFGEVNYE